MKALRYMFVLLVFLVYLFASVSFQWACFDEPPGDCQSQFWNMVTFPGTLIFVALTEVLL